MGGDHSFKFGGYWRDNDGYNSTHTRRAMRRCALPDSAELANPNDLRHAGDRLPDAAHARRADRLRPDQHFALRAGHDHARPRDAAARHPLRLQPRPGAGIVGRNPLVRTCCRPSPSPAPIRASSSTTSRRASASPTTSTATARRSRARTTRSYWGQVGTGAIAGQVNPVTRDSIRYPWVDTNHDKFVQAERSCIAERKSPTPGRARQLESAATRQHRRPPNTVDPNLKNDRTDEIILGVDREVGAGFAVGANYIWRRYSELPVQRRAGPDPADYVATTFTPPASPARAPTATASAPATARRSPTTSRRSSCRPSSTLTNFRRLTTAAFNGVELTARKRMSHHWLMNTSFAYNSTIVNNGFAGSIRDGHSRRFRRIRPTAPTAMASSTDYLTAGSGLGNVFVNAKWLFKVSGLYQPAGRLQRVGVLQRAPGLPGRVRR